MLIKGALIAALYLVLTMLFAPIGFFALQLRISEMLCILPIFTGSAVAGLAVGCAVANIFSPFGLVDVVFGSLATLLSAFAAWFIAKKVKNSTVVKFTAPLPAVIFNALIIGGVLFFTSQSTQDISVYWVLCLQIGAGQLASCYLFGVPLAFVIDRSNSVKKILRS